MKEKSLVSNYIFNTIYTLLNILFPLITTSYISRVLLADGVGKVSFAANIVSYFLVIAQLGVPRYGPREIAKKREFKEEQNNIFWEIFLINFISTFFMVVLYYISIINISAFNENRLLMLIMGLSLVFNFINVDWFYTGMEEYKYITIRSIFIKLVSLVCLFIFVKSKEDFWVYGLIQCCGIGGNYLFNIFNLRRFIKRPTVKLNLRRHMKSIIILLSMTIAVELYAQLDTTMIGLLCTDANVGYYTNPMRMIKIIIGVVTSLSTVLLPRLSWYYERGDIDKVNSIVNIALKLVIYIAFPACLGVILIAKPMILVLFGGSFNPSILTIRILAFLIPVIAIGNLFGTQILMIVNKEKKLLYSVTIGAGINIILNIFLIPNFQQNGAALASVIAETIVMITQYIFAKKYVKLNINIKFLIKTIIALLGMMFILDIRYIYSSSVIELLIKIGLGGIIYIVISFIIQNEMFMFIKDILLKKLKK